MSALYFSLGDEALQGSITRTRTNLQSRLESPSPTTYAAKYQNCVESKGDTFDPESQVKHLGPKARTRLHLLCVTCLYSHDQT
jgi:hypothetical protein